jgi:hypothetical protein
MKKRVMSDKVHGRDSCFSANGRVPPKQISSGAQWSYRSADLNPAWLGLLNLLQRQR